VTTNREKAIKVKHSKVLLELRYLYADLEYHELMEEDAKREFSRAFFRFAEENEIPVSEEPLHAEEPKEPEVSEEEWSGDSDIAEYMHRQEEEPKQKGPIPDIEAAPQIKGSDKMKKLFKQIASLTHPDKIPDSDPTKGHKTKIFLETMDAMRSQNWFKLQQIANELGLDIPEPDKEQLNWMRSEAERIKKTVHNITQTYAWVWYNTEQEDAKEQIMRQYFSIAMSRGSL
jgi:hypothetical protein